MRNQILILAAGQGKRMQNPEVPKVLVMLGNKPLILHLLDEVSKVGQLAKPVIVVGFKQEVVRAVLGSGYAYVLQEKQLGTGHAVLCAKESILAENVLVLYGDMPFIRAESLSKIIKAHTSSKATLTMFTANVNSFDAQYKSLNNYGRIIRDSNSKIIKITEYKDATEDEKNIREVNPGIYMFNSKWLFSKIYGLKNKNSQGEFYLTDMVELCVNEGNEIGSLPISPLEVLGVNTLEQLEVAKNCMQSTNA